MNENQENTIEQEIQKEAEEITQMVVENVPEEKQEELAKKIEQLPQPQKGLAAIRWLFENTQPQISGGTAPHSNKKRGVGITRKDKSQSKKARLQSKKSRKANRGK